MCNFLMNQSNTNEVVKFKLTFFMDFYPAEKQLNKEWLHEE